MKTFNYKNISQEQLHRLFSRPAIDMKKIGTVVQPIVYDVKKNGDKAVSKYAKKFDRLFGNSIKASALELSTAKKKLDMATKAAINNAAKNIKRFHLKQKPSNYSVETIPGVSCWRKHLPVENVGLYIPGGSAVLVSTMLMLGIPAKIAGCKRVIVTSPIQGKEIYPALAYAAKICGVKEFYKVGGAHAVAMMAYGTESIAKVDKILGPGNQFVTMAKTLVSNDPDGCTIDMPAGPSEVLIIADEFANPAYVASDLLAQAEHGTDSQVILLTTSRKLARETVNEMKRQIKTLPRKELAAKSLNSSFTMIVPAINEAIKLSNKYAPEHLILNLKNAEKYVSQITNAGSVFIGAFSPESAGDYASGTNHALPTYGYAKSIGGVCVESFMKPVTFQKLTRSGLKRISSAVIQLAKTEKLDAHANSVRVRLKNGN